jgi:hypothetical protein
MDTPTDDCPASMHHSYEAPREFDYRVLADFRPEDSGNVRIAVAFIFVVVVHGCVDDVEELVEITGPANSLRMFRENRVRVLK